MPQFSSFLKKQTKKEPVDKDTHEKNPDKSTENPAKDVTPPELPFKKVRAKCINHVHMIRPGTTKHASPTKKKRSRRPKRKL